MKLTIFLFFLFGIGMCSTGNKYDEEKSGIIREAKWYFYQLNITSDNMLGYYYENSNLIATELLNCSVNVSSVDSTFFKDTIVICLNFNSNENNVLVNYGEKNSELQLKRLPEAGCFTFFEEEIIEAGAFVSFEFDSLDNRRNFIDLLKENNQILHPWLKKEAMRRGFIQ